MCDFGASALAAAGAGSAAATAAGATAAATAAAGGIGSVGAATLNAALASGAASSGLGLTLGLALQIAGLAASVGGALSQGNMTADAERMQAEALQERAGVERALTGVQDARSRAAFRSEIRRQTAELAARGIDLSSPTAIALGENAAREMTFESQAIRSGGAATQAELSASARSVRARGRQAILTGRTNAAGSVLSAAPQIWPELLQ
ncbi:hypothetical protein ACVDG3_18305 [Meridianimarinicoccus sp. RP-17]|uniref:hypothetical protein n=1 Tax=Meridianimarinicoccus zhengii TaxID=2056810 RepID=UPI000DAE3D5D|nr:hypothetical protein [Phycocomes zhengii]